ncbi:MAG: hypothetical protein AAGB51_04420 [Planctomycetota bacterium]
MGDPSRITRAVHRGILLWIVLMAAALTMGVLALQGQHHEWLPHAFGFTLCGLFVATRSLACRYKDMTTLGLAVCGAGFGWWFPIVNREGAKLAEGWAQAGVLPEGSGLVAGPPLAIAAGGLVMGIMLYVSTGWLRVAQFVLLGTLLSAGAVLLPDRLAAGFVESPEYAGPVMAGLVWEASVAFGLIWWGVEINRRFAEHGCPYCGRDLRGVASPTCPSCGKVPAAAGPAYEDGMGEHARVNKALRDYYQSRHHAPDRPALPAGKRRVA